MSALGLALVLLVPLALAGGIVSAVLTAVDAAQLAVSRHTLEKATAERPAAVRERVLHQHADAGRTLASVSLGRVLGETVMVTAIAAICFSAHAELRPGEGWALPLLATLVIAGFMALVMLAISPRTKIGRASCRERV